ncbi:Bacterial periplasmic spermidine/putrescine-binding protein [Trema orientale]|uniref:Bacterial periplasmic spermidine/putrescine-binding protein n=1 Tax=Trema orientale TaxID=63057 RepID=A0A2P5FA28_TREOI|nr:Bacterial periplasmic spermidine/putrescine-binding protein [Trema orientale]
MAALPSSYASLPLELPLPCTRNRFPTPNSLPSATPFPHFYSLTRLAPLHCSNPVLRHLKTRPPAASHSETQAHLGASSPNLLPPPQVLPRLAASALLFLGLGFAFGARACSQLPSLLPSESSTVQEEQSAQDDRDERKFDSVEKLEDKKLEEAFETWKSKTYALTVPLKIVALRGSVPPSWIKDFMQSQGKRLKFQLKFLGSLEGIFSDLSTPFDKGNVGSLSVVAADMVSVGDSWLNYAIERALIQPVEGVEDQDWFKGLSSQWKVYLRRNYEGRIDPDGKIWAAPYRWGCMVIAYKKSKFRKHNLAPVEDWADLWRPELGGRIAMVDSPREVVGAVLKYMGASYNINDINLQVDGGRDAIQKNLELLANQVRLFDNTHYLKAFGVGDVWLAVGWSSDVIPVAKRMSNVAVVVPKSGASLWADLWAIPAASRLETNRIGGRVRGPSPLIHQWTEFCLQAARAVPFKQEVIPGASPSALESASVEVPNELLKGKPKLDTNLIAGIPPPDILARCEFLEPLSDSMLAEYQWLISSIKKSDHGLIYRIGQHFLSFIQTFWPKLNLNKR